MLITDCDSSVSSSLAETGLSFWVATGVEGVGSAVLAGAGVVLGAGVFDPSSGSALTSTLLGSGFS